MSRWPAVVLFAPAVLFSGCFTSHTGNNNNQPEAGDTVAYVSDWASGGLRVIDVSDPTAPVEVGSHSTPHNAMDVFVVGDLAYVADWEALAPGAFHVFDISNPARPNLLGSCDAAGGFHNVAVEGTLAFLANGTAGLRVADVSDPTAPVIVSTIDEDSYPTDVVGRGSLAYVAAGSGGLWIVDVTDPANPAIISSWRGYGFVRGVALDGDLAYLGHMAGGLYVVDVSESASPIEVAQLQMETDIEVETVFLDGGYAYVTAGPSLATGESLRIVDISDPTAPSQVSRWDAGDAISEVFVLDGLVYLADGVEGLKILDVSSPADPIQIGTLDTPDFATGVFVVKRTIPP